MVKVLLCNEVQFGQSYVDKVIYALDGRSEFLNGFFFFRKDCWKFGVISQLQWSLEFSLFDLAIKSL